MDTVGTESRGRFFGLFGRLSGGSGAGQEGAVIDEALLAEAIEHVVDGTEENIRLVPGYKKKLRQAVVGALSHADRLVEQIPGPMDVSCRDYSANPYVNAFFASTSEIEESVFRSSEVRDYAAEWSASGREERYVLLCMRKVEKETFGMEMIGDDVVRDVPQTSVSFRDHRVYPPAPTEAEARSDLRACFFDGLITRALANIMELRAERRHLDIEHQRLAGRARRIDKDSPEEADRALLSELEENRRMLQKVGHITAEVCLDQVIRVLEQPDQHIQLHHVSLNLDRMGIKVAETAERAWSRLDLAEAEVSGQPTRVVVLARLDRAEVIPASLEPRRHDPVPSGLHT